MERVEVQPCTGFANVGIDFHYDETKWKKKPNRFVEMITGKVIGKIDILHKIRLPKYDLSQIKSSSPKFVSQDFDIELYQECLRTKEGQRIFYDLRKKKTNAIVNRSILQCKNEYRATMHRLIRGDVGILIKTFKDWLKTPVEPPAVIAMDNEVGYADPMLSITVEELWEAFKKAKLIKSLTIKTLQPCE